MPNVWKWTAKDKDGKPVESAPGLNTFISRGPESEREMRAAAKLLLDNERRKIAREGGTDPGYELATVEPVETISHDNAPVGNFVPAGGRPVQIGGDKSKPADAK